MKPTIHIITQPYVNVSRSFFGGAPKLPSEFEWPVWDATEFYLDEIEYAEEKHREFNSIHWLREIERCEIDLQDPMIPLTFLGQIDLEDIPRYGEFPRLPPSGILYFFWDVLLCPPGWRASSKGSCRVFYLKGCNNLESSSEMGDDDELHLCMSDSQCNLLFEPGWTASNYYESEMESYSNDKNDSLLSLLLQENLEELPNGFPEKNESTILINDHSSSNPMHLLLGSPMEIQNPMQEMCQLCSHGFNSLDYNLNSHTDVAHLQEGVKDWRLLLQLDCDDNLDWEWGDAGMLYFWIRQQDLEKQDFSNVWCELQCS